MRKKRKGRAKTPRLTFGPLAWLKLRWLLHRGDHEVGGYGFCPGEDPLRVEDILLVPQEVSWGTVSFDCNGIADLFDEMTDAGYQFGQFDRVWVHTHPDIGARPTRTDWETFDKVFGRNPWAVMFVLARGGQTSCHLRVSEPESVFELPVRVDWAGMGEEFGKVSLDDEVDRWEEEFRECVRAAPALPSAPAGSGKLTSWGEDYDRWCREVEKEYGW